MASSSQLSISFDNLTTLIDTIIQQDHKLIYLAGASASGKSYIWEELVKQLTESGKKVLLISSDSYYSNESQMKYLLYGTFDHPKLINYDILQQDIMTYFQTGKFQLPVYSFSEKRTTHHITINEAYDIIIVEGLYTINSLPTSFSVHDNDITAYNVLVRAPIEEIIFRRLIRDQARVKEPLNMLINIMSNVFPMWKIFGATQEEYAHCLITNNYTILEKEWRHSQWKKVKKDNLPEKEPYTTYYTTDYIYNDSDEGNGKIIISEIYRDPHWLLDHVILQKRSSDPREEQDNYESISMSLYTPGISTEIHTLLQLAGLNYEWSYTKIIYQYSKPNDDKMIIYKEKFGQLYQLISPNKK